MTWILPAKNLLRNTILKPFFKIRIGKSYKNWKGEEIAKSIWLKEPKLGQSKVQKTLRGTKSELRKYVVDLVPGHCSLRCHLKKLGLKTRYTDYANEKTSVNIATELDTLARPGRNRKKFDKLIQGKYWNLSNNLIFYWQKRG